MNMNDLSYLPSAAEAEVQHTMAKCSVTGVRVYLKGNLILEHGAENNCPHCGGKHVRADFFNTEAQVKQATSAMDKEAATLVRELDGTVRIKLFGEQAIGEKQNYRKDGTKTPMRTRFCEPK
jgi:predicted  nucleic acid-binding Zn-ribbon protein